VNCYCPRPCLNPRTLGPMASMFNFTPPRTTNWKNESTADREGRAYDNTSGRALLVGGDERPQDACALLRTMHGNSYAEKKSFQEIINH
jgi:hypothetical protein